MRCWILNTFEQIWCVFYYLLVTSVSKALPLGQKATLPSSYNPYAWWRHQLETFSALLALCAGNSPVTGEFPAQRPVTRSFDVSFDLRVNKRLTKQSWGWWFGTPSRSLRRQCNGNLEYSLVYPKKHTHGSRLVVLYFGLYFVELTRISGCCFIAD